MVVLISGLSSSLGLFAPSSTTARDYTSAEVNEIVSILRHDSETRHGLLFLNSGDWYEQISLDLWEAVLGKPDIIVTLQRDNELWTYKTKDGSISVMVNVSRMGNPYAKVAGMPWLHALETKFIIASGDKSADREALKQHILAIKNHVDKLLPKNPYEGKSPEEIRQIISKEDDKQRRKDQEQQDRQDAQWQAEMERMAKEREITTRSRRKADSDFYDHLRDYFSRNSSDRSALLEQADDWIAKRSAVIAKAWREGKDWNSLPLPDKKTVSSALADDKPIPVK